MGVVQLHPLTMLLLLALTLYWAAADTTVLGEDKSVERNLSSFELVWRNRLEGSEHDPYFQPILQRIEKLERENAELRAEFQQLLDADPMRDFSEQTVGCCCSLCASSGEPESHATSPNTVVNRATQLVHDVALSGFIQLDSGWFNQDEDNRQAVGDVTDTTGIRRLRLRASGQVLPDTSFVIDLDFAASGHPSFRDVKFMLHEQELVQNIQIGYFAQPFSLDAVTSGRDLLLLERQLPFALVPFRQTGVGVYGTSNRDRTQWSMSGYRFPTNSFGVSQGESGGWGVATRATAVPIYQGEAGRLLHFGGSYSLANPGTNEVRYAIEPGFFVTDPAMSPLGNNVPVFVDTGNIPTDAINNAGLEFASQLGPLNMQTEVIGAFVDQIGGPNVTFAGASAKLAYVLTGEVHPYHLKTATFDRIRPREPSRLLNVLGGAWETVTAWSYLDLNDENIAGGRMHSTVLGVNRYVNDHVKLQVNVIRVLLSEPDTSSNAATITAVRVQAEF
jgi:phosphate-selective porin OprO and OprP